MKINLFYESNYKKDYTTLDVPDEELTVMIEADYQERLAEAEDKDSVERRDPQTILDEEVNKPYYNSHHKESRRHVVLSAYDPFMKLVRGCADPELAACGGNYAELRDAIKQLQPQQQRLLRKVYWEGKTQRAVALEEGVKENSVSDRMKRAIASLKRILEKEKKLSE